MASPSQPSATGTLPRTRADAVSITLSEGGRYPPFSTSRYLPSGESTLDMGNVSSGICWPTGAKRQPLLSRNPPPGSGPTCSRGAGWEPSSAALFVPAYGRGASTAKQYSRPAPPVLTRFSWLQPRLGCVEFHDVFPPPVRSKWPSWAVPSPLLVQYLQV